MQNNDVHRYDDMIELDDASLSLLNTKIQILQDEIKICPKISVTYFVPDKKKASGEYVTSSET